VSEDITRREGESYPDYFLRLATARSEDLERQLERSVASSDVSAHAAVLITWAYRDGLRIGLEEATERLGGYSRFSSRVNDLSFSVDEALEEDGPLDGPEPADSEVSAEDVASYNYMTRVQDNNGCVLWLGAGPPPDYDMLVEERGCELCEARGDSLWPLSIESYQIEGGGDER